MGVLLWFGTNWFDILQSIGIVAGLLFTGAALRLDEKTRRITNLIEITKEHREIWSELYSRPELARISEASVNLTQTTITPEEELFVSLLILHLNSAYHAMKAGVYMKPDGLREDVQKFFSRPIARAVWEKTKALQDADLVRFVEACLSQTEAKA